MASRKRSPTRNLQEQYMKAKMYGEYRRTRREGDAPFDWTHIPVIMKKEDTKNPKCVYCGYLKTTKAGCNIWGNQRYKCKSCERTFTDPEKPVGVKTPKKAGEKSVKVRTLDDLRLEKELKDLKAEITKKDVMISKLKTKVKKLNGQLISPEQDKKRKRQIYIENPEFLEIS